MSKMVETSRIAKVTSKVKFNVILKDPADTLNSGDTIEGFLKILNTDEKKAQKIKGINVDFWEHVYVSQDQSRDWADDRSFGESLPGRYVGSQKVNEFKGAKINPGEMVEVPFQVRVPGGLHINEGGKVVGNRDWFVGMSIGVKSKLVPSYQYNRIIPVQNSDRTSDWLD